MFAALLAGFASFGAVPVLFGQDSVPGFFDDVEEEADEPSSESQEQSFDPFAPQENDPFAPAEEREAERELPAIVQASEPLTWEEILKHSELWPERAKLETGITVPIRQGNVVVGEVVLGKGADIVILTPLPERKIEVLAGGSVTKVDAENTNFEELVDRARLRVGDSRPKETQENASENSGGESDEATITVATFDGQFAQWVTQNTWVTRCNVREGRVTGYLDAQAAGTYQGDRIQRLASFLAKAYVDRSIAQGLPGNYAEVIIRAPNSTRVLARASHWAR